MTGQEAALWEKALALQDRGQALQAIDQLRQLGRRLIRQRNDPAGILDIARQLCFLYDHGTALTFLEALVRQAGAQPALLVRLALLMIRESRYPDAARFARAVLEQARPDRESAADARLLLAECGERQGHFEEADQMVAETLKTHPASIPAHRLMAVIQRRQGRPDLALATLSDLLKKGGPPHWETCRAWFELGHLQDQLGNHAAAWRAWITAREHHAADTDWNVLRHQAGHVWDHVRDLHRSLSRDQPIRWGSGGQEELPGAARLAVLTGHPRSGTTLLEQALDAHSGIVSLEETTVFTSNVYRPLFQHGPAAGTPAERLDSMEPRERRHWQREYLGLTRLALGEDARGRLRVDKNPDLLQLLPAWTRIFPGAKIIVMLRDPRDLLVSMFSQALPPNHTSWSYRTPESTAAMISQRLGMWHHLRQALPAEGWHEIRYENLVSNFRDGVNGVLEFLGCPPEDSTAQPEVHALQKVVRSPTYAAVQTPVHTRAVARWRNYEEMLAPHLKTLRPALEGLGYVRDGF